jgi:hypothetical protein
VLPSPEDPNSVAGDHIPTNQAGSAGSLVQC